MMATLHDPEIAVVAKTANTLMDQWQNWFRLVRRGKATMGDAQD